MDRHSSGVSARSSNSYWSVIAFKARSYSWVCASARDTLETTSFPALSRGSRRGRAWIVRAGTTILLR